MVRRELTERFGGVTAYTRAPASGLWKRSAGDIEHDDLIMVEVVADALDRRWWSDSRRLLEARFKQETIHIRAVGIERLSRVEGRRSLLKPTSDSDDNRTLTRAKALRPS